MLFNSYIFVLLFLPMCVVGYFGLNRFRQYALSQVFLLGMSLWFYGFFNPSYLVIILASIVFNYAAAMLMERSRNPHIRKAELMAALVFNLGILFYFKYYDFFVQNINRLFSADFTLLHLVLPLGISFFTFQQISYIVDTYRGETIPCSFIQYASFVCFFPQLIAGPIVSHDELIPQSRDLSRKQLCWENLARGMYLFSLGLAKKVLIADTFGKVADFGFAPGNIPGLSSLSAILVMLAYTVQVYFDFSGYSDMAIGLGKMLNIDLPVNFNSPYKALTITDFWDRWHMTLTRFFTKYVYIPLGGNRRGTARTYGNILVVYLLSGFWHGAGWNFIVWGVLHGLFTILTRHKKAFFERLHPVLSWGVLFVFLNVTWVFFRAEQMQDAWLLLRQAVGSGAVGIATEILDAFTLPEVDLVLKLIPGFLGFWKQMEHWIPIIYVGVFAIVLGTRNAVEREQAFRLSLSSALTTAVLLLWCLFSFSGVSSFLYFNF